jgi:cytochrome oxidase Cu insertion factor (SCO1/SenC/PrrC family)
MPSPATQPAPTPAPDLPIGPVTGALAPDLTLPDLSGNQVTLSALRGKAVLLNFWTTW